MSIDAGIPASYGNGTESFSSPDNLLSVLSSAELWVTSADRARIERYRHQALDYSFPAGQAQPGIQLAAFEVPRLLEEIERLKVLAGLTPPPPLGS